MGGALACRSRMGWSVQLWGVITLAALFLARAGRVKTALASWVAALAMGIGIFAWRGEVLLSELGRWADKPYGVVRPLLWQGTWKMALEHPALVAGLVLAGSSGLLERTMVKEITVRPSREWLVRKIGELFYDKSLMREADIDRAHRELTDRGGARAMVKLSRSARSDHLGEKIANILAPTLLIWGKQDVVTPPEAAAEFREKLRDSRIVWFDRCGHAPMMECPELFADALLAFCLELDERQAKAKGG